MPRTLTRRVSAPRPKDEERLRGQIRLSEKLHVRVSPSTRRGRLGWATLFEGRGRKAPDGSTFLDAVPILSIPVDNTGNIPADVAVGRLMDVERGDRQGRRRNPVLDLNTPAQGIFRRGDPRQFLWYLRPNEADMAGIDDPDADWWKLPAEKRRKELGFRKTARPPFVFIKGAKEDQARVQAILHRNFTARERDMLRGLTIEVRPSAGRGVAGFYQMGRGPGAQYDLVVVDKDFLRKRPDAEGPNKGLDYSDDTLVHELVHVLRARDAERRSLARRPESGGLVGSDSDLEEAFTELETSTRARNTITDRTAGYYDRIRAESLPADIQGLVTSERAGIGASVRRTDATLGFIHDRARALGLVDAEGNLLTTPARFRHEMDRVRGAVIGDGEAVKALGPEVPPETVRRMFRGAKGKRAWRRALDAFTGSAIARMRLRGQTEAIDTFWRYEAKAAGAPVAVATHVYSPKANVTGEAARAAAVPDFQHRGGRLLQWQDGRLTDNVAVAHGRRT